MSLLLIGAGGTGGHIYPGIAVAREMLKRGWTVRWMGTAHGMEAKIVPEAGIEVAFVPAAPLKRGHLIQNLAALGTNIRGVLVARGIVERLRPTVVLGMGGFASVPASAAAIRARVPLALHEQNAIPGLANRFFARRAMIRMAGVAGRNRGLERSGWEVVGMPVAAEFWAADRSRARRELAIAEDARVLLVFGGSRGSRAINEGILGCLGGLRDLVLIWVAGNATYRHYVAAASAAKTNPSLEIRLVEYAKNMPALMAAADLAVTRAGAMTLAELAAASLPAVLIPYPHAAENHQEMNAMAREESGGAIVLRDAEIETRMYDTLERCLSDPAGLEAMREKAAASAAPGAAGRIADLIESIGRKAI